MTQKAPFGQAGWRSVTLRDVAQACGVSVATASKALNGRGSMTDATRARIKDTAARLGFRPNGLAQSLLRKRSFTIGLLTNDSYGRFSLPVMTGIEEALVHNGVSVFMCNVADDPVRGAIHVDSLIEKRVDGIIVTGRRLDRTLPVDLSDVGVPVLYVFTKPAPGAIGLVVDDEGGARLAVEHLVGLGRRRIAHVSGPQDFEVVHLRARACRDVLARAGLDAPVVLSGSWSEHWGHEAVANLFADGTTPPDAIFCGNDQIARGVVDGLRERGVRVPEDVAVVGFDNWEIVAAETRPPLTTIDMNLEELGRQAGHTLLALVEGRPVEWGMRRLPCRLVVRRSCGGVAEEAGQSIADKTVTG